MAARKDSRRAPSSVKKKKAIKEVSAQTSSVKKRAVKKGAAKSSSVKKRVVKKGAAKSSSVKKRVVKKGAVQTSSVKKRVVKKGAAKSSSVKKRVVKKGVAKSSSVKKRVVKKGVAKSSSVKKRVVKKGVAKSSAVKKRVLKKGAAQTSAVKKRVVKKGAAQTSAVKKRVVKKGAAKTSAVKKRVVKKGAAKSSTKKVVPKNSLSATSQVQKIKRFKTTTLKKKPFKEDFPSFFDTNEEMQKSGAPEASSSTWVKYSDADLEEFRFILKNRIDKEKAELSYLRQAINVSINSQENKDNSLNLENKLHQKNEDEFGVGNRTYYIELISRKVKLLQHLDDALLRIENKTYGICRVTGKLIDKERLKLVPHATLSKEAKDNQRD